MKTAKYARGDLVESNELHDGTWCHVGTRAALIASGIVGDRPFPGDAQATGKRGERFVDPDGRKCVISKGSAPRHAAPTFRVSVYPTRVEIAEHEAERRRQVDAERTTEAQEKLELLRPEVFRESLIRWVRIVMREVGDGNTVWANMAGRNAATLRLDGMEAEALLAMLRQIEARIGAARIVPCTSHGGAATRASHLRVAWSSPAMEGSR